MVIPWLPAFLFRRISDLTTGQKSIIRLFMKQILKHIYHVDDNECSVYLVDSGQGLVLIDAGMYPDMIRRIDDHNGAGPEDNL